MAVVCPHRRRKLPECTGSFTVGWKISISNAKAVNRQEK
jgi:hypothetical protein